MDTPPDIRARITHGLLCFELCRRPETFLNTIAAPHHIGHPLYGDKGNNPHQPHPYVPKVPQTHTEFVDRHNMPVTHPVTETRMDLALVDDPGIRIAHAQLTNNEFEYWSESALHAAYACTCEHRNP